MNADGDGGGNGGPGPERGEGKKQKEDSRVLRRGPGRCSKTNMEKDLPRHFGMQTSMGCATWAILRWDVGSSEMSPSRGGRAAKQWLVHVYSWKSAHV